MRVRSDAKAVLTALTVLVLAPLLAAQQKPSPNTPVFKSKTELVLVPVSVHDKSGKHVAGLKQDAFGVRQDGKEQKIAVFEEIATGIKPATRPQLPPGVFTNTIADAQQRRLIIIALDTINTAFTDQAYAREHLIKYLSEQVQPDALLCLVTIHRGGIKVIHDFTTDPKLLIAALHKVRGRSGMVESETSGVDPALDALQNDPMFQGEVNAIQAFIQGQTEAQRNDWRMRVLVTLDAFNELAQAFAGVPGRKSLLWATGSFPLNFTDPNEAQNGPQFREILPQYERTWQLLNSANVAVYPVDVRGLVNSTLPAANMKVTGRQLRNGAFTQTASQQQWETIASLQTVADMTGGRAFFNTNDLAKSFSRATEDSESYYLLGYYRDSVDTKPGWRKLKVDVKANEHVEVRSRSGFYVAKAAKTPEDTHKTDIQLALASPLAFTGIPMLLHWANQKESDKGAKKKVPFELILPANGVEIDGEDNNHVKIEFLGVVTDPEGRQVANFGQTMEAHLKPQGLEQMTKSGITYTNSFDLPPGDYNARVLVRDAMSGRIGTVIAPLKVQ